ncbi:hypothetical protein C8Q75DRAFT_840013 [Abortiporus biennis]|nr:hypothetical protein C8Q75DRAFT_840013 [Abortiporus biennis]
MLNTGTPPLLTLAVTGQISPMDFCTVVVISSNPNTTDKFQSSYNITKIELSSISDESLRNPLLLGKSNGPPFQQHLYNVVGKLLSAAYELCNKNDKASLVKLQNCLTCIETILESSKVKCIFRESSLSEEFKSKPKTQHDVPKTDNAEVDYEEVAADKSEEEFGATWLQFSWHKATHAAVQVVDLAIKVQKLPEICLVRLADYSSDAINNVKTNGQEIVHAEAGLMALLKNTQERSIDFGDEPYGSTVKFFTQIRECAIGASKKCCYMCHLLGEYMFNNSSENLTLHLPGSYGYVFLWDPPSFGIPDMILEKLAQKLRQDVIRLAVKNVLTISN